MGWPRQMPPNLEEPCDAHPDRAAVIEPDGSTLTFRELLIRVDRLAGRLATLGAGPESLVGVMLPRSADAIVALLAIWRIGAAFVPLDVDLPSERLGSICIDARLRLVVGRGNESMHLADDVSLIHPAQAERTHTAAAPAEAVPENIAYVMYTSGSTGRQNGVAVTFGGVAALVDQLESAGIYGGGAACAAWNASIAFDASVQQWTRVLRGDTVVILDKETRNDPWEMVAFLDRVGATHVDLTPSHLAMLRPALEAHRNQSRRPLTLLVGGEPLPAILWDWLADMADRQMLQAFNVYGPTECTVDATAEPIHRRGEPRLGRPLEGVRAYVLDAAFQPVPPGSVGELFLAGPGVGRGYYRNPGLTASRFLADPFRADGSRMFRTGDRASWTIDSGLLYLGRTSDSQVKLHGHRIELGEIESTLLRHSAVSSCVVILRDDLPVGDGLVAYWISAGPEHTTSANLKDLAVRHLPRYMVPSAYMRMESWPLTLSGKVDRRALPAPSTDEISMTSVAPEGPLEQAICAVWGEVLGAVRVGATDNFFELGANSLMVMQVQNRLQRAIGVRVRARDVFANATARSLAGVLSALLVPSADSPLSSPE